MKHGKEIILLRDGGRIFQKEGVTAFAKALIRERLR